MRCFGARSERLAALAVLGGVLLLFWTPAGAGPGIDAPGIEQVADDVVSLTDRLPLPGKGSREDPEAKNDDRSSDDRYDRSSQSPSERTCDQDCPQSSPPDCRRPSGRPCEPPSGERCAAGCPPPAESGYERCAPSRAPSEGCRRPCDGCPAERDERPPSPPPCRAERECFDDPGPDRCGCPEPERTPPPRRSPPSETTPPAPSQPPPAAPPPSAPPEPAPPPSPPPSEPASPPSPPPAEGGSEAGGRSASAEPSSPATPVPEAPAAAPPAPPTQVAAGESDAPTRAPAAAPLPRTGSRSRPLLAMVGVVWIIGGLTVMAGRRTGSRAAPFTPKST